MRASSHFSQGNGTFRWLYGKLLFLGATPTWVTKRVTVIDYFVSPRLPIQLSYIAIVFSKISHVV